MRFCLTLLLGTALAACSPSSDEPTPEDASTQESSPMPVEPDGGIGDGAGPPDASGEGDESGQAGTMPSAMIGDWHINALDRAPTAQDCDDRLRGTVEYDRLITVRDGGYSYFETGGRIETVHRRTDSMIDATFDTTYADTPTSERRDFALQDNGTLAINIDDGDGTPEVTEYVRCPGSG